MTSNAYDAEAELAVGSVETYARALDVCVKLAGMPTGILRPFSADEDESSILSHMMEKPRGTLLEFLHDTSQNMFLTKVDGVRAFVGADRVMWVAVNAYRHSQVLAVGIMDCAIECEMEREMSVSSVSTHQGTVRPRCSSSV